MKKLLLLLTTTILLLILVACGSDEKDSGNQADNANNQGNEETYKMRIPSLVDENNIVAVGFQKFKDLVEEKSDGRIEVELFLNGAISSSNEEEIQLLIEGSVEAAGPPILAAAQIANVDGLNIYDFPFLYEDKEELFNLMESDFGQKLKSQFEDATGTVLMGYYDVGSLGILNNKHTVTEPSDLKGLNIRTPQSPVHMDSIQLMGGNPTPMPFPEIYTALQQGTIDGLTTTLPLMYDSQFYEVGKYITKSNHALVINMWLVNKEFYESLPEDLQKVVDEASAEMIEFARNLATEKEIEAIEKLEEAGVEVVELTEEQFNNFKIVASDAIQNNIKIVGEQTFEEAMQALGR